MASHGPVDADPRILREEKRKREEERTREEERRREEERTREEERRREEERKDEEQHRPRKEPHGAWLVVRYDTSDFGARPVPAGDVFWLSPDIWVTGGTGLGTIVEGVPFSIHARVWNLGAFMASPTRVDFAILDPALGITTPQLVGTAWIPYLPGLSTAAVTCPNTWTRESVAGGHPCLLVKASSTPMDPAPPGYNSYLDRHTGQRNLTVVPAGSASSVQLALTTTAVLGTPERVQLAATALLGGRAEDLLRPGPTALRNALTALERAGKDAPEALRLRIDSLTRAEKESPVEVRSLDIRPFVHVKGMAEAPPVLTARRAAQGRPALLGDVPGRLTADTRTEVIVDVEVPQVDADVVVHLWQVEDGVPTGGYSVLVTRQEEIAQGGDAPGGITPEIATNGKDRLAPDATAPPASVSTDGRNVKGMELEELVIAQYPAVQATLDVSRQLARLLPIRSAEELAKHLDNSMLVIGEEKVDVSEALTRLPEEVFPIKETADLVAKVAAVVRVASSLARDGRLVPQSERLARIALDIAGTPTGVRAGIPAGHFAGPSLFGYEKEA